MNQLFGLQHRKGSDPLCEFKEKNYGIIIDTYSKEEDLHDR